MYPSKEPVSELWAILNLEGQIMWSSGGSSTSPQLLLYTSEASAEAALRSPWIKQVIPDRKKVVIKCIYTAEDF